MKKISLIIFILALFVGLIFSNNCSVGSLTKMSGVQGSGTSKIEKRDISGFSKIEVSGAINLEVSSQTDFNLLVQADDNLLANIKTEVSGDTLKIYSEDKISPKTQINIRVSMPEIEGLHISGASSGKITNVKAVSLELRASGASKIKIEGEAQKLDAEASGASLIDAENLRAVDAEVEASGASKAIVSATNDLDVDANGASRITYTGEPKNIRQNSSGASSVKKK